jgi:HD-GYP domain-containing protein (c-di-GMP phosphodiesterase class II)
MMSDHTEESFLFIKLEFIQELIGSTLPFSIFIYNENNRIYSRYFKKDDELKTKHIEYFQSILEKQSSLAIQETYHDAFIKKTNIKEEDLQSLQPQPSQLELDQLAKIDVIKAELDKNKFHYNDQMTRAMATNNFMPIIERARKEIEIFPYYISETTSNAVQLTQFMDQDNATNRIVALSYFTAKGIDIKQKEVLGELVCAAFYANIGLNFMNIKLLQTPYTDMSFGEKSSFQKHPHYSLFLLNKSGIKLSKRCLDVIELHHELPNGSGYPRSLKKDSLDVLAQIIGMVENFVFYCNGIVCKHNLKMSQVLSIMRNQMNRKGLNTCYRSDVLDYFTAPVDEKAKAS